MSELCSGYGAALYSLAAENKMGKSVLSELHEICRALSDNPDYMKVLGMPLIPFEEKEKLIDEAFSGAHEYVLNFLKILVKEHLQENIEKAAEEYEEAYMKDSGMIRAEAVSAVPLFENELEKINVELEKITGKSVKTENRVDKSLLGGLILRFEGRQIDASLKTRLEGLLGEIKNRGLESLNAD